MKGQISIDYLAGAMIFFGSLVFLVSNVMTTLPAFSQAQQTDELTLSAWSLSEVVMNDRGYWENSTHSGADWHHHLGDMEILGVHGEDGLSEEKVDAFTSLNQSWIRATLQTSKKVNADFREVVDVRTHRTFQQGDPPSFLTEPAYHGNAAGTVHYGVKRLDGRERFFLLTQNTAFGWYNRLRVSDDWDFTGEEVHNLTESQFLPVGDNTYVSEAGNTQISGGDLLILHRNLGRAGDVPQESVDTIAAVNRYGVMNGNVVEVTFRVWE